jgi:hypothetical protein
MGALGPHLLESRPGLLSSPGAERLSAEALSPEELSALPFPCTAESDPRARLLTIPPPEHQPTLEADATWVYPGDPRYEKAVLPTGPILPPGTEPPSRR